MLYKMKHGYLWLIILRGHHVLDKLIIYRITERRCDLKPELFIIKTDGKTSGIFRTLELHSTLINATKDIDFTKLGQGLNFRQCH